MSIRMVRLRPAGDITELKAMERAFGEGQAPPLAQPSQ